MTAHTEKRGTGYFVKGGFVAGIIAGMVMAMFIMVVTAVSGMGLLAAPEMIGQTILKGQSGGGVIVLGLMGHMMNSAIFGLVWGLIWRGAGRTGVAAIVGGMAYGLAVWLVMTYVALPVLRSPLPGPLSPAVWAIAHVMFGVVLGLWPVVQREPFAHQHAVSGAAV